jgi:hypothetical protein
MASYLLRSAAATEFNVDSTFTTGEVSLSQTDALIGQGQTPNLIIKALVQIAVTRKRGSGANSRDEQKRFPFAAVEPSSPKHRAPDLRRSSALNA